ncbi:MAG: hypothetical protein NTW30_03115 [Candidatus Aenigmarchaeota archaeon]|nr:hypothetical protein [Candidatus Aenigmarchaeota archaeon]
MGSFLYDIIEMIMLVIGIFFLIAGIFGYLEYKNLYSTSRAIIMIIFGFYLTIISFLFKTEIEHGKSIAFFGLGLFFLIDVYLILNYDIFFTYTDMNIIFNLNYKANIDTIATLITFNNINYVIPLTVPNPNISIFVSNLMPSQQNATVVFDINKKIDEIKICDMRVLDKCVPLVNVTTNESYNTNETKIILSLIDIKNYSFIINGQISNVTPRATLFLDIQNYLEVPKELSFQVAYYPPFISCQENCFSAYYSEQNESHYVATGLRVLRVSTNNARATGISIDLERGRLYEFFVFIISTIGVISMGKAIEDI